VFCHVVFPSQTTSGRTWIIEFICSRRFFRDYLKLVKPGQDVEITLQADPLVFAQLLSFCKLRPDDALAWRPAAGSQLSVLLAAHFLQVGTITGYGRVGYMSRPSASPCKHVS
jgi:hypothetical protein